MRPSENLLHPNCSSPTLLPLGNSSSFGQEADAHDDMLVTSIMCAVMSLMFVVGVAGNVYTLVVMCQSMRSSASMYVYIVNLALADLLYLSSIPFVVCTNFASDWYFGDLGCRLLFSLDLLTMHASIFILAVMSTERYVAVVRPLDTVRRSRRYRKALALGVWVVSLLLALPMIIMMELCRVYKTNGEVHYLCVPSWRMSSLKIYLTVLFVTSILAPGLIIGSLYVRLARTYWLSQTSAMATKDTKRSPNQKVLYLIFSIVLAFWACFLPFWTWQLVSVYHPGMAQWSEAFVKYMNLVATCLTYSNSCINPFLYTLLTKNYQEYLRNKHGRAAATAGGVGVWAATGAGSGAVPACGAHGSERRQWRSGRMHGASQRSISSVSQPFTETMMVTGLREHHEPAV
ncbi:urotensin-2 receptor-like [Lethenteron reissneri]|uniref:urotensin-2 receptor-like n=1 Tax=Lethenteron reissneri TaxID=7753 RepID=UPI002AB786EE|nr:urotensin-2 receptor-like [Lethenteron reissneri]